MISAGICWDYNATRLPYITRSNPLSGVIRILEFLLTRSSGDEGRRFVLNAAY